MKLELQRNHAQQMEHNEQRRAMEQAELEQYRRLVSGLNLKLTLAIPVK